MKDMQICNMRMQYASYLNKKQGSENFIAYKTRPLPLCIGCKAEN